ncbi:MAG TPA: PBP1A family penicillin-binding protein [Geminicoccaceae bacterium]
MATAADRRGRRARRQPAGDAAAKRRRWRLPKAFGRRMRWLITGPIGLVLLVIALGWYVSLDVDDLKRRNTPGAPSITLLDHEGEAFASFGQRFGDYVDLEQISDWLPKAAVAVEDRRFWQHPGIDPLGIGRALIRNIQAGRVVEGGSTISQQLAKLAFLTPERSLSRKIKEALYTVWLEARLDKEEILEAYLNRVYFGGGAYGVDAAAERYFDKTAADLSLAESAMLAGLIRAPSRYAPTRDLALAQRRAGVVLDSMVDAGLASPAEAAAAKAAPATLAAPKIRADTGYFADWVAAETRLYATEDARLLVVETTLDRDVQRAAEAAVQTVMDARAAAAGVDQAALVAMTPDGKVRAMLGGRSYAASQFNRAAQAERQPGSAFKLFVYLAALEAGIDPSDTVSGRPVEVDGWQPRNFDDVYPERLTVADSFARSVNTAAVRLSERAGRDNVIRMAERLGITTELRSHPSLALGTSEVSPIDLTAAYATLANGGRLVWPQGIREVRAGSGEVLYRAEPIDEVVLEPSTVRAMTAMLEIALSRGTGRQADLRRFAAGKTGTSADHRDAWFVGFIEGAVVGVWVGNDDGRPMDRVTGGGLPALIFKEFVLRAYGDETFRPLPPPRKPGRGPYPVEVVGEVIGDLIDGAIDGLSRGLKRVFGN